VNTRLILFFSEIIIESTLSYKLLYNNTRPYLMFYCSANETRPDFNKELYLYNKTWYDDSLPGFPIVSVLSILVSKAHL